ncbi:hypothetical protein DFP95_11429 [Cohnella lupini]|uniref:Uncharacterized protein n=1 Tax=Cohnella lupini TaxID=1294267 RepID=A0A3D9I3N8_9BACL|nr:hypothetical protein DFP95_11429 [Cohnella lupini]
MAKSAGKQGSKLDLYIRQRLNVRIVRNLRFDVLSKLAWILFIVK